MLISRSNFPPAYGVSGGPGIWPAVGISEKREWFYGHATWRQRRRIDIKTQPPKKPGRKPLCLCRANLNVHKELSSQALKNANLSTIASIPNIWQYWTKKVPRHTVTGVAWTLVHDLPSRVISWGSQTWSVILQAFICSGCGRIGERRQSLQTKSNSGNVNTRRNILLYQTSKAYFVNAGWKSVIRIIQRAGEEDTKEGES